MFENILNAVAAGLIIGCLYGLMCIGLGLIFGIMKIVNFAQGELLMLGMYVGFLVGGFAAIGALGPYAAPFVAALIAGPVLFGGGALLHRFLLTHVSGMSTAGRLDEGGFGQLIVTFGISLILQNGGLILFGSQPKESLTPLAAQAFVLGPLPGDALVFLNKGRVLACGVAIIVAIVLWLVMERTTLGKALRAAADNTTAAIYMGIDVGRAHRVAFGLGVGITAVAGGLIATYLAFTPFIGLDFVIIMYSGVVLGGVGSILGRVLGRPADRHRAAVSALVLSPQLQNTAIFVVFLLIIGLRPAGPVRPIGGTRVRPA